MCALSTFYNTRSYTFLVAFKYTFTTLKVAPRNRSSSNDACKKSVRIVIIFDLLAAIFILCTPWIARVKWVAFYIGWNWISYNDLIDCGNCWSKRKKTKLKYLRLATTVYLEAARQFSVAWCSSRSRSAIRQRTAIDNWWIIIFCHWHQFWQLSIKRYLTHMLFSIKVAQKSTKN